MERCIQSAIVSSPCLMCGGRAEKVHLALVPSRSVLPTPLSGLCAEATADSGSSRTPHRAMPSCRGRVRHNRRTVLGPHPDDPWYRDGERREVRPPLVPRIPIWFK